MKSIGEKIRDIRTSKGISQTVVATACKIKQSSYANIENGNTSKITIEVGKGISDALGISFNELFDIAVPLSVDNEKLLNAENERLNQRIIDLEKMLILQEKVNKNYQNAILEAYYWASGKSSAKLERELREIIDDQEKINNIQDTAYYFRQDFFDKLKNWGCIEEKDIEDFYNKKADFFFNARIAKNENTD